MSSTTTVSPPRRQDVAWPPTAVLSTVQGIYYLVTGLWPLLSIRTFQMATGWKTDNSTGLEADHWLVMTVAALITVIGLVMLMAGLRHRVAAEIVILAVGAAFALLCIDVIYVARQVISPIYLADAAIEAVLVVCWIAAIDFARKTRRGGL
jgi:hypothetical protein